VYEAGRSVSISVVAGIEAGNVIGYAAALLSGGQIFDESLEAAVACRDTFGTDDKNMLCLHCCLSVVFDYLAVEGKQLADIIFSGIAH